MDATDTLVDCPRCDAQGELPDPATSYLHPHDPRHRFVPCRLCDGAGRVPLDDLPDRSDVEEGAW